MDLRRSACLCTLLAALLISGPVSELGPAGAGPAMAAKLKVPRFVSLRFDTVNLRAGPGTQYPIEWVYKRRGLPVEVIRDLDTWRQVRDRWGTVGWIHLSNLSGRRTVLIDPQTVILRKQPEDRARAVAKAEPGAIAKLEKCAAAWCRIAADGHGGWVRRAAVWGVYEKDNGE